MIHHEDHARARRDRIRVNCFDAAKKEFERNREDREDDLECDRASSI